VAVELPIAITLSVYALMVALEIVAVEIAALVIFAELFRTTLPVPVNVLKSVKPDSHEASVVPEARIQVHIAVTCDGIEITVFPPDEFTVKFPVLLLHIWNVQPVVTVFATGSTTV
jgi:hypothetical protein